MEQVITWLRTSPKIKIASPKRDKLVHMVELYHKYEFTCNPILWAISKAFDHYHQEVYIVICQARQNSTSFYIHEVIAKAKKQYILRLAGILLMANELYTEEQIDYWLNLLAQVPLDDYAREARALEQGTKTKIKELILTLNGDLNRLCSE